MSDRSENEAWRDWSTVCLIVFNNIPMKRLSDNNVQTKTPLNSIWIVKMTCFRIYIQCMSTPTALFSPILNSIWRLTWDASNAVMISLTRQLTLFLKISQRADDVDVDGEDDDATAPPLILHETDTVITAALWTDLMSWVFCCHKYISAYYER